MEVGSSICLARRFQQRLEDLCTLAKRSFVKAALSIIILQLQQLSYHTGIFRRRQQRLYGLRRTLIHSGMKAAASRIIS